MLVRLLAGIDALYRCPYVRARVRVRVRLFACVCVYTLILS